MLTTKVQGESTHITKSTFGVMPDGKSVEKYTLSNSEGMEVDIITYGGIITRWMAPDKNGIYNNIVLGFDDLQSYFDHNYFFGALVGRFGNRIAKGLFSLDDKTYNVAKNHGENHLHGGINGFDKVLWQANGKSTEDGAILELTYTSVDGEEGYPGNLDVKVTYILTGNNELDVRYEAATDRPTIVNLTQHSYFNLSGDFSQSVLDHELFLDADAFLPVDDGLIPTGEFKLVKGTPFDFKKPKSIGLDIEDDDEQLKFGAGYDHCWVLNKGKGNYGMAAMAHCPQSGRMLEVYTEEPGLQFYSGNFMDGTIPVINGKNYAERAGFCLETQHFPDSPNQKGFPSARLDPGETYSSRTMFKLSAK